MAHNQPSLRHSLSLEQVLDRKPLIVEPETSLIELVRLMVHVWDSSCRLLDQVAIAEHALGDPDPPGCALVITDNQLLGLFTEQDLVNLIATGRVLEGLKVSDVMSPSVITLVATGEQDIFAALSLMRQHQLRHLPVVDAHNQVLGLVTPEAILRVLQPTDLLRFRQVRSVMTTQVVHAAPTVSMLDVAQLMAHHQLGCVVITEQLEKDSPAKSLSNGSLQTVLKSRASHPIAEGCNTQFLPVGMITERDIVQFQSLALNIANLQAQVGMSAPLFWVSPEASLWTVHQQMQQHRVQRLVVIGTHGELQGLITQTDLLRVLDPIDMYSTLERLQDKVHQLETEKVGLQRQLAGLLKRPEDSKGQPSVPVNIETEGDRFFTLALDMLCVATMDGYFWRLNPAFERTLGFSTAELMAHPFLEFVHPEDRQATLAEVERLSTGQDTIAFENRYRCKDGSYKWFLWTATPYLDEQLLYATARDITDRKQAEQKIREQAALLNVATDAILVQDLEGTILFWNQGAERLYGWPSAAALGKNANQLLYNAPWSRYAQIKPVLLERGVWQEDLHQVTQTGEALIVESRWTLVRDEVEQPKFILVVNSDITQKKQLEGQFLRSQRLESLGTLAGGIAHDLNNILTPMLGVAQLLPHTLPALDAQSQRLLTLLTTSVERGSALVKQVLSFSRGVEGEYVVLQIRHLVSELQHIMSETFPKSIELSIDLPQSLWPVRGDVTQLHQVLMNLCVNGRDAMPNGGILSIVAQNLYLDEHDVQMDPAAKLGPYIEITVADTGVGIPSTVIDKIFDPFFTTKPVGKGTGLGLSTVLGIVKSHRGFVKVYSEAGQGSQFKIYLPAAEQVEIPIPENTNCPQGQGELILVVDDEGPIREITKTSLEAHQYRVLAASDGIEAIALYAQHPHDIDLVLMDMIMPAMDGVTAIRTLKKINPQIRIIAISGLVSSDKTAAALAAGVQTFLPKPYTSDALLQALYEVLHGNPGNSANQHMQ